MDGKTFQRTLASPTGRGGDLEEFKFRKVELIKTETLGSGSYGVVCIAKCDELLCAAKLLFSVLFDAEPDSGSPHSPRAPLRNPHRMPMMRFEQECRFLSHLKHPNIIQYLGTSRDPESRALVLLMELMDESLTHLLARLSVPLPYHLQVSLAHDIAMAVAYLHSNNIIHRDLSSNNILLLDGGYRAKVSDFGMSTLVTSPGGNSRTTCPGTPCYMPPEALDEPPKYSEMLDSFSFGVLLVQILTKLFPDPTDRFTKMEVQDPREPSSLIEANIAVPELTRRREHIEAINKSHPLLQVAKECLRDMDHERPSARQLCSSIEVLKTLQRYKDSSSEQLDFEGVEKKIEEIRRECQQQLDARITEMKMKLDDAEEGLLTKDQILRIRTAHLSKLERDLSSKKEECESLKLQIRQDVELEEKERALEEVIATKERQVRRLQQQVDLQDQTVQNLQLIIHRHEQDIGELQSQLRRESQRCGMLLQKMSTRKPEEGTLASNVTDRDDTSEEDDDFEDVVLPRASARHSDTTKMSKEISLLRREISSKDSLILALQNQLKHKTDTTMSSLSLGLKQGPTAPLKMYGGSTTSIGAKAYFRPSNSSDIFEFYSKNGEWSQLLCCVSRSSTLIVIEDKLTVIGGTNPTQCLSLETNKWKSVYPPMFTGRHNSTAIKCGGYMIVAGGVGVHGQLLSSVEAMNLTSKKWISCSDLPFPVCSASGAVINENLYLLGGKSSSGPVCSVLTCTLKSLISRREEVNSVWRSLPNLPFPSSTCVSAHNRLFALGGLNNHKAQNAVYKYDFSGKCWEYLLALKAARSDCLISVVTVDSCSKLVVVGGYTDHGLCNSVEIVNIYT